MHFSYLKTVLWTPLESLPSQHFRVDVITSICDLKLWMNNVERSFTSVSAGSWWLWLRLVCKEIDYCCFHIGKTLVATHEREQVIKLFDFKRGLALTGRSEVSPAVVTSSRLQLRALLSTAIKWCGCCFGYLWHNAYFAFRPYSCYRMIIVI